MSSFPTLRMLLEDADADDLMGGIDKLGDIILNIKSPFKTVDDKLRTRFNKLSAEEQQIAHRRLSGYVQRVLTNMQAYQPPADLIASMRHDKNLLWVCALALNQYSSSIKVIADQVAIEARNMKLTDEPTIQSWLAAIDKAAAPQVSPEDAQFFSSNQDFFERVLTLGEYAGFRPTTGADLLSRRLANTAKTHPDQVKNAVKLLFSALMVLRNYFARAFKEFNDAAVKAPPEKDGQPEASKPGAPTKPPAETAGTDTTKPSA